MALLRGVNNWWILQLYPRRWTEEKIWLKYLLRSFDTMTRVAWPTQTKQIKIVLYSNRMNSDNNIYECCVDKAYYQISFRGCGVERGVDVVVCLVSVLLFRGYRYPFLPPSQIIIASPLPSAWDLHASCAALWCCSFELIVRPSVGNVAKKTVSGIRHIQLAIVISIPETYVSSFGILSLAQSLCTETCCLLSII